MIPLALAERLGLPADVLEVLRARDARRKAVRVSRRAAKAKRAAKVAAAYAAMPRLRPDAPGPSPSDLKAARFPSRRTGPRPPKSGHPPSPGRPGPLTPVGGPYPSRVSCPDGPKGAQLPSRRNPNPHPLGDPLPSRCKGEPPHPAGAGAKPPPPLGIAPVGDSVRMTESGFRMLFTIPKHVRGDLRDLRAAVKAGRVTPENCPHLADALERALGLILEHPATLSGLTRRLRGLARLTIQIGSMEV